MCIRDSYAAMDIQQPTSFAQVFPAFWREVELPVYLENDANLACEGEAFLRRGAGSITADGVDVYKRQSMSRCWPPTPRSSAMRKTRWPRGCAQTATAFWCSTSSALHGTRW